VRSITDLMVLPGLINLDFADVRTVMTEMGKAMMGTGEASGEARAMMAAQNAIQNPLLDEVSLKGAKAVLVNVTGGPDMTLLEVDEACNAISAEVDPDANTIFGAAFDDSLTGKIRVSVVATGMDGMAIQAIEPKPIRITAPALKLDQPASAPVIDAEFDEPAPVAAAAEAQPELITAEMTVESQSTMQIADPAVEGEFDLTPADGSVPQIITSSGPHGRLAKEDGPLFIPERRNPSQKSGWLSLFGRQRAEPQEDVPVPQFRNKNAVAGSRPSSSAMPVEQGETEQDDLEIPSFLRRLAN
jgi:cell division protein FtsZ